MAASQTSFKKGISGNPKGRPPKARALTAVLEKAGERKIDHEGEQVPIRQVVAYKLWNALNTGIIELEGRVFPLKDADEYLSILKFLQAATDGPPPAAVQQIDLTTQGQPLGITMIEVVKTAKPAPQE